MGIALSERKVKPKFNYEFSKKNMRFHFCTWIWPVSAWRVVQNEYRCEIRTNGTQILGVGAKVQGAMLTIIPPLEESLAIVQLVCNGGTIDLHGGSEYDQLVPLRYLKKGVILWQGKFKGRCVLTIFKKKSTWGLLCTKNLTGCRSIVTFRMKSGGVPGLTVGRSTPSWNECIRVSSRSKINVLRLTMPEIPSYF